MSQNKIFDPVYRCRIPSIGGVLRVWVAQRRFLGDWTYQGVYPYQFGQVTGNTVTNIQWYRLYSTFVPNAVFNQEQALTPARNYAQSLSLPYTFMEALRRDGIEQMVLVRGATFIFEDLDRRFWLLGETKGCYLDWNATTDAQGGTNGDALVARCIEPAPIREVLPSYVQNFVDLNLPKITDYEYNYLQTLTYDELANLVY